jgi:hypothetical protein
MEPTLVFVGSTGVILPTAEHTHLSSVAASLSPKHVEALNIQTARQMAALRSAVVVS